MAAPLDRKIFIFLATQRAASLEIKIYGFEA